MSDYFKFKSDLKKKSNKNFTFVKVRGSYSCYHCLKTIKTGEECLTFNPKNKSRCWYCENCVQLMLNVQQARIAFNSVVFDDEGAVMACLDWIDEAEGKLEEAKYY